MKSNLPPNWISSNLGDVTSFLSRGISPKYVEQGGIEVINQKCIRDHKVNRELSRRHDINAKSIPENKNVQLWDGLVNSTGVGTLGRVAQVTELLEQTTVDSHVTIVRPNKGLFHEPFFGLILRKIEQEIEQLGRGAVGQIELPRTQLANLKVTYPESKNEQQKIVDKIEELFSVIDACDQTILDTENKLSTYEYSFLKKCIYGDYLAESSNKLGNNSNSVELRSLPKGWQWKKLPELGELARGKSKHRPRNDKSLFGGKYPFIQTGEVRNSYKYIKSFSTTYNEKGLAQSKLWEKGTLCITIAANIADTAILDFDACFPDSVVGFIADTSICEVEYIEFFIRTEKERLAAYAPATAQKNINLKTLNNMLVPLPPLEEQRKIVEMAEEHSSVAHKLKTDFSDILRTKNLLKQSILKQAFEGKLV